MRSIEWWHIQWPWRTPHPIFKVTAFLKSNISKFLSNTNRKSYAIYRMVPLSITRSDPWPDFKVTTFLKPNSGKTARLKDKVTRPIAQEETMHKISNSTMFIYYWIIQKVHTKKKKKREKTIIRFGDLDWPLKASRGFVSVTWAVCLAVR